MSKPLYIRPAEGGPLPDISHLSPFKAVVVIDEKCSINWQSQVSDWLVAQGCRFMMAWGIDCTEWDDSVDLANIERFNFGDIPEDQFVFTTWHEHESLAEVFWFCEHAVDIMIPLDNVVIVHVGTSDRGAELVSLYMTSAESD